MSHGLSNISETVTLAISSSKTIKHFRNLKFLVVLVFWKIIFKYPDIFSVSTAYYFSLSLTKRFV